MQKKGIRKTLINEEQIVNNYTLVQSRSMSSEASKHLNYE